MSFIDDQNVLHGPKFLHEIPRVSYGRTLFHHLEKNYSLPIALIDGITRKSISHKTILEQSLRLAYSLQKCGVTPNDVIAISSENSIYYVYPLFATFFVGATATLFNPKYTPREFAHVSNISKPSVIFCSQASVQQVLQAQKNLSFIKRIIIIDGYAGEEGAETLETFMATQSRDYRRFEPVNVDSESVALILYSSGTTGLPKGVMLTNYNLNVGLAFFADPRYLDKRIVGVSTGLGLLPFFHGYGMMILTSGIYLGEIIIVLPKFEEHLYLKTLQEYKIKLLMLVPPIAKFLANSDLVSNYDLSHVVRIISGAAPLGKHIEEVLQRRLEVRHVGQGYGLTETSVSCTVSPVGCEKQGTVGKLLPEASLKVVHGVTAKTLGPGEVGELYFLGPHIMKGYAKDIASTNDVIDARGWFKTGDVGYYDTDGYVYVVDRVKELIKYKGFQVAPAELEAVLLEHPGIADAGVVGVPDSDAGEIPLAFVVKKDGLNLTTDEIASFVAKQVSNYKQLRGGVKFIDGIPKGPSGKILRNKLRELLLQKSKI